MAQFESADGWISEDSSFYGDEDEQARWEAKANYYTKADFRKQWDFLDGSVTFEAHKFHAQYPEPPKSKQEAPAVKWTNPYEGMKNAWQLNETVDDFLERLPPLEDNGILDWLWIANPYAHGAKAEADEEDKHFPKFMQQGQRLLEGFMKKKEAKQPTNVEDLKQSLISLASECNIRSGKWMLRPSGEYIPSVWAKICHAVVSEKLGTGAKISADYHDNSGRLICVYTRDIEDVDDIKRVLHSLDELDLLPRDQKHSIWYKADAWTMLGIDYNNDYGLRASLYGSSYLLNHAPADKKQSKFGGSGLGKTFSPFPSRKRKALTDL